MKHPYIVQARHTPGGRLMRVGTFNAIGPAQAIAQAIRCCVRVGESPIEFVATAAGGVLV